MDASLRTRHTQMHATEYEGFMCLETDNEDFCTTLLEINVECSVRPLLPVEDLSARANDMRNIRLRRRHSKWTVTGN